MQVSEACIAAMKELEGYRGEAYQDCGGVWTVGYGWTLGVGPATTMTEFAADHFLRLRLAEICAQLAALVHVPLTPGQVDALADFAYNVGLGNFEESTLLKELNAGNYALAAAEFPHWVLIKGKRSAGLLKRREMEQAWFNEPAKSEAA